MKPTFERPLAPEQIPVFGLNISATPNVFSDEITGRALPTWLGKLAGHSWLPFASQVKLSIHWPEQVSNLGTDSSSKLNQFIERQAGHLQPSDLIYLSISALTPNLQGWTIKRHIVVATKESLTAENLKSLRIYEDVHLGQGNCGIVATLSWAERFNSAFKLFTIEDSYLAIRAGFQRRSQTEPSGVPKATGQRSWGMQMFDRWLDFVEEKYGPRDILKLIVASPKIEKTLVARFKGAQYIHDSIYLGGEAKGNQQRLYCFNREQPPKVLRKSIAQFRQERAESPA